MFDCSLIRDGKVVESRLGLNEASVLAGPPFSMLDVQLYVDAELATTYSCDGLIVSTPVGSTAHCLSAGGPILRKNLHAFVILPISPHTLTNRPVVDSADRVFELAVPQPNAGTSLVLDGRVMATLQSNDRVRIDAARPPSSCSTFLNKDITVRSARSSAGAGNYARSSCHAGAADEPTFGCMRKQFST